MAVPRFRLNRKKLTSVGLVALFGPGPAGGGTLFDMSGRGNHGTLTNGPTWQATERGWALDFVGGSSQYVSIPAAPVTATPLMLSAWIRCTDATNAQGILWLGDASSHVDWWDVTANGNAAGDPVRAGTINTSYNYAESTSTYNDSQWHHVCGVFASATSRVIYFDGIAEDTDTTSRTPTNVDSMAIGVRADASPANYFTGQITDVRVYNRAPSAAEIWHIYRSTLVEPYGDILLRPRQVVKAPAAAGFTSQKHLIVGGGVCA